MTENKTYNLRNVHQVTICEIVGRWDVRGEDKGGYANVTVDFPDNQEEQARALAVEWCKQLSLETYTLQLFTKKPYYFPLKTINAKTGVVLSEHIELYDRVQYVFPREKLLSGRSTYSFTPEWQAMVFIDKGLHHRQVMARSLVLIDEKHPDGTATGLAYAKEYEPGQYCDNPLD